MNKNCYVLCLIVTVMGLWTMVTGRALAQPSCYMIDAKGTVINLSSVCQPKIRATTTPEGNTSPTPPTTQNNVTPPPTNQTNNNSRTNQPQNPFGNGMQGVTSTQEFTQPTNTPSRFQRRLPVFVDQGN